MIHQGILNIIGSALFRRSVFVVYFTIMLYGIFKPTPPVEVFVHSDKAGHLLAFFILSVTAKFAMPDVRWFFLWPGMVALCISLEYLQSALRPLRVFSLGDTYSNIMGVIIGCIFISLIHLKFPAVFAFRSIARKTDI